MVAVNMGVTQIPVYLWTVQIAPLDKLTKTYKPIARFIQPCPIRIVTQEMYVRDLRTTTNMTSRTQEETTTVKISLHLASFAEAAAEEEEVVPREDKTRSDLDGGLESQRM